MKTTFFGDSQIEWSHLEGGPDSGDPIDHWTSMLDDQKENGALDLRFKWGPISCRHFLDRDQNLIGVSAIEEFAKQAEESASTG
ncbi:hypothetical protein MK489_13765 [Myxococcota bacterium]|nr:hypothetical protein [Myxococcota bacterium]